MDSKICNLTYRTRPPPPIEGQNLPLQNISFVWIIKDKIIKAQKILEKTTLIFHLTA